MVYSLSFLETKCIVRANEDHQASHSDVQTKKCRMPTTTTVSPTHVKLPYVYHVKGKSKSLREIEF
ncbi:hypothetical protein HanIR_Chr12g0607431 [Helianthus annuus]|nr:hypothetical protein HanIR_Chr12g0607431 [Helianthus annuus]